MLFDQSHKDFQNDFFRKNLINSLTGFKSVSLVGTKSESGVSNLSIISQIIHVGASPPYIGLLFRPHVVARHTLENILSTKEFTLNHIRQDFYKKAHHTSARWETSEFESCGLTEEYTNHFGAPFVKESTIRMACRFTERLDVQANGTHFIIGSIEFVDVPEEAISDDGFVDVERAGSITCSGLDSYHTTRKLARLSYAKPDHFPREL